MKKVIVLIVCLLLTAGCAAQIPPAELDTGAASAPEEAEAPQGEEAPAGDEAPASGTGSVPNPEGIVAEDIDVPEAVLEAARLYVQERYAYWCENTGAYGVVDGMIRMMGEPATYDNWKIEYLVFDYRYEDLEGMTLDIYRMNYRLHTTTPDKLILAGGMDLDEKNWVLPTYPDSTYLVFSVENGEQNHLFNMMVNDSGPGRELFTSDLIGSIQSRSEEGLA